MSNQPYPTSYHHILAELERIDLLLQLQVGRARQVQAADEDLHGLYVSDEEVDRLLAEPAGLPHWARAPLPLDHAEVHAALEQLTANINQRKVESRNQGVNLRLDILQRLFLLSPFEVDLLLITLLPEIDLRYERIFGYLQDDVTRRRPSVDLVLNLLSPTFDDKLAARRYFAANAPLFKHHLLHLFDNPAQPQPPLLSKYLKVDARVVDYLFDGDVVDIRLAPYVHPTLCRTTFNDLLLPAEMKRRLLQLADNHNQNGRPLLLYLQGPYGVGKESTAAAIAGELDRGLLVADGSTLLNAENLPFATALRLIQRETLLQNALLYWRDFDAYFADDRRLWRDLLLNMLEERPGITILAGSATWEPSGTAQNFTFVRVELPQPTYAERLRLWQTSLNGDMPVDASVELDLVAGKFRFTGGQIRDAVATARDLARWRNPDSSQITSADLYSACRLQSNRKLGELAHKIIPHYTWDDIVLPAERMQQLREIVNQVKYRALVYEEWGFERKLALGKGVSVLFAGPSGTGKTMAADIMAGELGLDIYKIDLSTVVSKYIGETEKNLACIFAEAETSNAILFFDEADALFGKRSEVRDAHDRYANIEISYLLQRMEEYDGVVILATNLRKNMDEAFVRRIHFIVEFPFPDEPQRRMIWQKIWPMGIPLHPDLDFRIMAHRFELAGGNIRNVALSAAFLAAADGHLVTPRHLLLATQREYQKMGRVVIEGQFEVTDG